MKKFNNLFLIIDAYALIHRSYHALPESLSSRSGESVNAVYGFSSILLKALKDFMPRYIAAAFDLEDKTFRALEFNEYKANREKAPDSLYKQVPRVMQVLEAFNIPILSYPGFEGDDIIGTLVFIVENNNPDTDILIATGDLDTLQLVSDKTKVYTMKRGVNDTIMYDTDAVEERFEFSPPYLPEYKGLRGDPSDNIPGIKGVGEKTAQKLISRHKTLEVLFEFLKKGERGDLSENMAKKILEGEEEALFSRMLATIRTDAPIKFNLRDAEWASFDHREVLAVFQDLNFRGLSERLLDIIGLESPLFGEKTREEEMLSALDDARRANILSEEVYKLEKDIIPVILKMERHGVLLDEKKLEYVKKEIKTRLKGVEKDIYKEAGREFNINSPSQLSEVLFSELEIDTKGIKKTPTKNLSTAAPQLEKIIDKHPIIEKILYQRELQKMLSTYIDPLPEHKEKDGRIHSKFHSLGTSTGRMSSSNPNMQNIPIKGNWASSIRSAFVAKENNLFLSCDYSQMELRIIAHLADDKNMKDAFIKGEDIHASTASLVFGVSIDNVSSTMRSRAKELNFGIIYGIGSRSFARSAGISVAEAQDFIDRYLSIFSGVAFYMEKTKEDAEKRGYVETIYGRKRFLPDIYSNNPMIKSFAQRAAINMPVQGSAADIVKMAMLEADKKV